MLAPLIISGVIPAIRFDTLVDFVLQIFDVFRLRLPIDIERFDLGAEKVIGARSAKLRQTRGIRTVDELQCRFVVLKGANAATRPADLPTHPGKQLR